MIDKKSSYPVILVPGVLGYGDDVKLSKVVPYFGTMSASVAKTIRSLDLDCYIATFTPAAGIWERTCELYAQIAGGRKVRIIREEAVWRIIVIDYSYELSYNQYR